MQARYDELGRAIDAKDWTSVRAIEAPGYRSYAVDGKVETGDQELAGLQQMPLLTGKRSTTTVVSVRQDGDTAFVEQRTDSQFSKADASGKSHQFVLRAESSDVWTRVNGQWLILGTTTDQIDMSADGVSIAHQVKPKA